MENYRKRFIRNNRLKKISSEPDSVVKRGTSGSRTIGSRPLVWFLCLAFNCLTRNIQLESPSRTVIGKRSLWWMAQTALSVVIKGPCLFVKAQFEVYAVFSYLLHNNAMLMS